jgi:molybdate transport system regulatory protein
MAKRDLRARPELELRVVLDGAIAIGPFQASLLEGIRDTGSIAAARRRLGASYAHVWKLVASMSTMFLPPLVDVARGGRSGGGARLTPAGHKVLTSFRRLERLLQERGRGELLAITRATSHAGTAQSPENQDN